VDKHDDVGPDVGTGPDVGPTSTSAAVEGLRERKKRQTRELISRTATEMFLDRGFEDVRVTEVADRCGVSEKTVYNYFPTKESLVLDREEEMASAIRTALGPGALARSPTVAALEVLNSELERLRTDWDSFSSSNGLLERFVSMIEDTPSLRAAQRDMMDRLVQIAAEAMAARANVSPDDPEPQIAATAILGLWRVQSQALRLCSTAQRAFEEGREEVNAEVARAARLIDSGLWAFEVMVQGRGTREQLRAAAEAAQKAGQQVAVALRQARDVWRQVQVEFRDSHGPFKPGDTFFGYQQGGARGSDAREAVKSSLRFEVEQWKQAQLELKQQRQQARRGQQRLVREALREQERDLRQVRREQQRLLRETLRKQQGDFRGRRGWPPNSQ
jgi:AcrR family transcriptional regulator